MKKERLFARFLVLAAASTLLLGWAQAATDGASRTRQFLVMGYTGLQADLERGSGPYLSTLADLLGVKTDAAPALVERVRALSAANPNIMDFADQVSSLDAKSLSAAAPAAEIPTGPNVKSGAAVDDALRHLTRGAAVTIYLKNGDRLDGRFVEYQAKRVWLRGAAKKSAALKDIEAIEEKP